ncbi:MAG: GNAT family N-acetyltransferase [Defluviitaleaceae bacterium]|nr:GNAT family N-acetyltransferase [Defluviitaleaceae bacterium]
MIREANISDFESIAALEKQVLAIHAEGNPDIFLQEYFGGNSTKHQEYFEECLQDEDIKIFVFEENREVLGTCLTEALEYGEDDSAFREATILRVENMCVAEKARGRRIGKHLLEKAKTYAKEIGATRLELLVWECNQNAREFYEHLGMSTTYRCMKIGVE